MDEVDKSFAQLKKMRVYCQIYGLRLDDLELIAYLGANNLTAVNKNTASADEDRMLRSYGDISQKADMPAEMVSSSAKRLYRKGLVSRGTDVSWFDRNHVELTREGIRVYEKMRVALTY